MFLYDATPPLQPEPRPVPLSDAERLMTEEIECEVFAMTHLSTAQEYRGQIPSIASYSSEPFVPNKHASSRLIPEFAKVLIAKWHEREATKMYDKAARLSIESTVGDLEMYLKIDDSEPGNDPE